MTNAQPKTLTVDEAIGERAHMIMWRTGRTQLDVSAKLGMESTQLSRKLRGVRPWYARDLVAFARELGTTVAYLCGEEDPRPVLPRLDSNQQPSGLRFPLVKAVGKSSVAIADRGPGKVIPLRRSAPERAPRVAMATPAPFGSGVSAPERLRATA